MNRKHSNSQSKSVSIFTGSQNRISSIGFVIIFLILSFHLIAQDPNWSVNYQDFQNTMTAIVSISDECAPSADENDIVAAFDMTGQIRGVKVTNTENKAILTIGSNGSGENIYFKVYDVSTNKAYSIYNTSIVFVGDETEGTFLDPLILNFDSDPTSTSGGPDLWVVDATSTNLEATGTGMWTQLPGSDGVIADPSDPNSLFTGAIGTTYFLAWTDANTDGCIPETDEVNVTFAVSEDEDTPERCSDGIDNDGNGLLDCQELSCGKPTINSITKVDPDPTSCTTEMSNGKISINHTAGNSFSLDNGMTTQPSSTFSGLEVGDYSVLVINEFSGCTATDNITLINTLNTAPPVATFSVDGPTTICAGNDNVNYNIDQTLNGNLTWSFTGADATINSSGTTGLVDFGDNVTTGMLKAVMANACTSFADSMQIEIASTFLCNTFSNCIPIVTVSNSLLESINSPQVFQAGNELISNATLSNNNFDFSAGQTLQFNEGFSIATGINFVADIKNCTP